MNILMIPMGVGLWDYVIFDLCITLMLELPFVIWLLRTPVRKGILLILLANATSLLVGCGVGLLPVLPYVHIMSLNLGLLFWSFPFRLDMFILTLLVEALSFPVPYRLIMRENGRRVSVKTMVFYSIMMNSVSWPIASLFSFGIGSLAIMFYLAGVLSWFPYVVDGLLISITLLLLARLEKVTPDGLSDQISRILRKILALDSWPS